MLARFAALLPALLLLPAPLFAQPKYATEVYQDFRGKPPMLPEFNVIGPDLDAVTKSEAAGFRITLPKTRPINYPVQLAANFVITGDFEITATYELLTADIPKDGWGTGVSLNLADNGNRHKFLKIGRLMRPNLKRPPSVFMAEYWTKGANDWRGPEIPTEVRSGQLRLTRAGPMARCQASEGPGKPFITVFQKDDFGTDDMAYLGYAVTDGNKPGYAVDARLVDLRVRYGSVDLAAPANVVDGAVAPVPVVVPVQVERKSDSSGWLALTLGLGLAASLGLGMALGLVVYLRRGRDDKQKMLSKGAKRR